MKVIIATLRAIMKMRTMLDSEGQRKINKTTKTIKNIGHFSKIVLHSE